MSKKGARSRAVLVSPDSGALFFPFEGQRGYDVGKINGTGIDKSFFGSFPRVEAEISSSTHRTVEPPHIYCKGAVSAGQGSLYPHP